MKYLNSGAGLAEFFDGESKLVSISKNFWSDRRTLNGHETINMICKGQLDGVARGGVVAQNNFVSQLFGIAG
ncbi:MAG: hypothetical protein AB4050_02690 [Synechococcus sp.]